MDIKQCKKRFPVIKLNQYFGGKVIYKIVDSGKKGVDMHRIKKEFSSRKDANKYVKNKLC